MVPGLLIAKSPEKYLKCSLWLSSPCDLKSVTGISGAANKRALKLRQVTVEHGETEAFVDPP